MSPRESPLPPRPRPHWRTQLVAPLTGAIAEDLLGVALTAAASGTGMAARPQIDKGIDLYFRRLRTMVTYPIQVKASVLVGPDGASTHYVPQHDLAPLSGGYVAFVHLPEPYDQLYERLFLIPDVEFRKRAQPVRYHGVPCYRFEARFAGTVDDEWAPFAVSIDKLAGWVSALPGWAKTLPAPRLRSERTPTRAEYHDIAALGSLWVQAELERVAMGRIMLVEDRVRLDPVTFLVHDVETQRFAGLHLRTATLTKTRRIHFDVKREHFFTDPDLWIVLVLLRPDHRAHDFVLLIPSVDIPGLGFSETMTLDPLTKRFRKYVIPMLEFGGAFLEVAFGGSKGASLGLPKAS